MEIKIVLEENAVMPKKATDGAAAYDLYIPDEYVVKPGRQIIPLGIKIQIPIGYQAIVKPRSGFSAKGMEDYRGERKDADVLIGTIDSDYTGTVGVIVISRESYPFRLSSKTRVAQMSIEKVEDVEWIKTLELEGTERGDGGFGHTGK